MATSKTQTADEAPEIIEDKSVEIFQKDDNQITDEAENSGEEKANEDITIGTSSVSFISSNPGKTPAYKNSAIKFQVNYSKSFKGIKFWKNGDIIEVSKESAIQFEEKGIGKELK